MSDDKHHYNCHQQVFLLSLMSFLATEYKGTEDQLQKLVVRWLPKFLEGIGGWKVVWGPAVWKHKPADDQTGPDHVSFVIKHDHLKHPDGVNRPTYVLSVAGTQTDYNKVINNDLVHMVVDFENWIKSGITTDPIPVDPTKAPDRCYISWGTAIGVYRLATVTPCSSAESPGVDICQFLKNQSKSSDGRIVIAGHSLGGPLSSTMALALVGSGAFKEFSPEQVLVYPTAGPAIGNRKFADLYNQTFPKIPALQGNSDYQTWNCMIVNRRDPISQAWSLSEEDSPQQNLHNLLTIFGKSKPPDDVLAAWKNMVEQATKSGINYYPIQAVIFDNGFPPKEPTNIREYIAEKSRQHTDEILEWMGGIKEIKVDIVPVDGAKKMTTAELYRTTQITCQNSVLDPDSTLCNFLDGPPKSEI